MEIITLPSRKKAQEQASGYLNNLLKKFQSKPILLLVSGGSAFDILFHIDKNNLNKNITISILDERYSKDPKVNNLAQLVQTEFFKYANKKSCRFIDTQIQGFETVEDLAMRFEKELKEWKKKHKNGKIIVTMGVGKDGHTAGIMPFASNQPLFKKLFEDKRKWVVGYDAGHKNKYPLRVTVTNIFLRKLIDYAVVYVLEKEKKEALKRVLSSHGTIATTPARVLREMKDVEVFTDIIS